MNNVSLVGRLSKDPEKRDTQNGSVCTMFQLCVQRGVRGADGNQVVDWIPCTAFAITCEYICKYAKKGDMLSIVGKIQTRVKRDSNGASTLYVEVVVSAVSILNPKPVERVNTSTTNYQNQNSTAYYSNENYEDDPSVPF